MATKKIRKPEVDKELLEQIAKLWENYSVPKQLIKDPTAEFTNEFFAKCLNELETNCFLMFKGIHNERLGDLMSYCPGNVDSELFLYVHVKHIMDLIKITYVTLTDFYRPPNRSKLSMKIFVNFLLFVKQTYHKGYQIIQSINNVIKECKESNERQKQLQEELSEIYQEIGKIREEINELQLRKENVHRLREDFEKRNTKELIEMEEKERETTLLQLQLKELEEQIKSVDENNLEMQARIVTEEEFNTMTDTLQRLKGEAELLIQKDEEVHAVFEEKSKSIRHLRQLRIMLDSVDLTTWNCMEEIYDAKNAISMAEPKTLEYQQDIKRLEEGIKATEKDIMQLKKQTKDEENVMKKLQKNMEKTCVNIEKNYETALNTRQVLKEQARLLQEDVEACEIKCQEVEKEIKRIKELNSNTYRRILDSQKIIAASADEKFTTIYDCIKKI